MGRFSLWRVNVFTGHEQRSRRFSSDVRGQVCKPLQFQVAQACCLLRPAPVGLVLAQRMNLGGICLLKDLFGKAIRRLGIFVARCTLAMLCSAYLRQYRYVPYGIDLRNHAA